MTPGPELHEQVFYQLIGKPDALTDGDFQMLRDVLSRANFNMVRPHIIGKAQLRVDIDLLESIRRFDRTSAALVNTTNVLTRRILWITMAAVFVGCVQLAVALISFFLHTVVAHQVADDDGAAHARRAT